MTRAQHKELNINQNIINTDLPSQNSSDEKPDQPQVVEILKKPKNGVELVICSSYSCYMHKYADKDVIKSNSGNCIYVPAECCMYLFTRSSSTYEVLMREIEFLCKMIGINELIIVKSQCIKNDVNMLLKEIRPLEPPRFLVIKDVQRITNQDDKTLILNDFHILPTSGHAGINRMTNNIKKYYFWNGLNNDVKNYVRKCKHCQISKINKHVKEPMVITTTANSSFEMISLDLIGPLEIDNFNNKYALTLQCNLTKFVKAYPLQRKDTETVAQKFVENFILRHGVPNTILTDQGTEFMSSIFSEICKLLNITKLQSTAYHHETIGALENTHKNLGAFLRIQCESNKQDWSSWLPYWCIAFNTSVHTETKYTPYELVFGKLCTLPSNLHNASVEALYNYDSYPLQLKFRIQKAQSDARENILISKENRKICYDKDIRPVSYKPGDLVLLKNQVRDKLDKMYLGPFVVIEDCSPNVKILKNNKEYITHKNNTKLFRC